MIRLISILLATMVAAASAVEWTPNVKNALGEAKKGGKDVLLMIGSAESEYTQQFLENVADSAKFVEGLDGFIFVKEIETEKSPFDDVMNKVMKEYGVLQYPYFLAMDAEGRAFAVIPGALDGNSPDDYVMAMKRMKLFKDVRDTLMKDVDGKDGLEKAKALHKVLAMLAQVGLFKSGDYYGYRDIIKTVMDLDADNKAGLKAVWDLYGQVSVCNESYRTNNTKLAKDAIEAYRLRYPDHMTQQKAMMLLGDLYFQMKKESELMALIKEIRDLDPKTPLGMAADKALNAPKVPPGTDGDGALKGAPGTPGEPGKP